MGTLTRATCDDCGYSAEVVFGGTKETPHEGQVSPFVCTDCREVVSVFKNMIPLVCSKCELQNVAPLEAPQRPLVLAEEEQKKENFSRNLSAIIKFIAGTYEAKGKEVRAPNVGKMLRSWSRQMARGGPAPYEDVAELRKTLEELFVFPPQDPLYEDPTELRQGGKCPRCAAMALYVERNGLMFD
jgi:hypothetical protein